MATAAPPVPPGYDEAHLYRLLRLTIDEGNPIVRKIFDEKRLSYKPGLDLSAFLKQERNDLQKHLLKEKYLKEKLFPKSGTPTHSIENFDLTLLVSLVRYLDSLGSKDPFTKQRDEKTTEALRSLQTMRNYLAHIPGTEVISEQDFQSRWIYTKDVLIKLNTLQNNPDPNLQQRIEECKTKPLDYKWLQKVQKESAKQKAEDEYQQTKENLKDDLKELYIHRHSTIPLSPLFEEKDTPLFDFYLLPKLVIGKDIQSLSRVFKSGSEFSREVYITADAGYGKTAFSKYLSVLWCQAHFPNEKHAKHLDEANVNSMREFEFLFLVLLRDSSGVCSIDDLIINQIVKELPRSELYDTQHLQNILHRERCLVVLDGLDEWNHPDTECGKRDKRIPHRNSRKNCTILTTTRPWRLSTTDLNTNQIDKQIKLSNLDRESALELTTRAMKKMQDATEVTENQSVQGRHLEANRLINSYRDFEQVYVPLILMYIICLWRDNIPVVKTKCELYIRIIELLLSRTINKYGRISETKRPKGISEITEYNGAIPQCFDRKQGMCTKYFTFLISLGKLAFERLFSKTRETRLVFDISFATNCLKEDFLKLSLYTGIITQDKLTEYANQTINASFSHKTVQEFFAALYISTCSEYDKALGEVLSPSFCNSIQDILDLSKVFIFISGIDTKVFSSLSHKLMKVINEDEITLRYRSLTGSNMHINPMKEIQNMFVSCIKESPDNKDDNICLQDFLFDKHICKQEKLYGSIQQLALQNKPNITSIFFDEEVGKSVSDIMDDCKFSDPQVHCQVIECRCGCEEEELFRLLSTSVKGFYISSLNRGFKCKDARSFWTYEQCETFHKSSQLEHICIIGGTMSQEFLNYIINVKSIKKINISLSSSEHTSSRSHHGFHLGPDVSNIDNESSSSDNESSSSDHGSSSRDHGSSSSGHCDSCPGLNFDLSQHPELRELKLSGNFTLWDTNKDENLPLQNMRNIEHVELWDVKMSSLLLRRLVDLIEQLEHSVRVKLLDCKITPIGEFDDIKNFIRTSKNFVVEYNYRDIVEFVTKK